MKRTTLFLLCLTALPIVSPDSAACRGQKPAHHQGKKHCRRPSLKAVAVVAIKVENPGCPGCLKTLREQLLKMSGVKAVKLTVPENDALSTNLPAGAAEPTALSKPVLITVDYDPAAIDETKILERMRFHDLHILEPSPGGDTTLDTTKDNTPKSLK